MPSNWKLGPGFPVRLVVRMDSEYVGGRRCMKDYDRDLVEMKHMKYTESI